MKVGGTYEARIRGEGEAVRGGSILGVFSPLYDASELVGVTFPIDFYDRLTSENNALYLADMLFSGGVTLWAFSLIAVFPIFDLLPKITPRR